MEGSSRTSIRAAGAACRADDGSRACLEHDAAGKQRIVVRDAGDQALFAYEPAAARCVVYAPTGDLVLSAPAGAIELDAGTTVRLRGEEAVVVDSEEVRARADRATIDADVVTSRMGRLRQTVELVETRAGRIVERARETYRDVEGLAQTRAGRIRQVSERAVHLLGKRLFFVARKDVKVDGSKIHLG